MAISDRKLYEDTLREICSFGAGNAATRLSKLINRKVMINVPTVWIKLPEEPYFLPGRGKEAVIVVDSHFGLEKKGVIFHLFGLEDAKSLASIVLGTEVNKIGEMEESALLEIGNILSGAIVGSIANFIGEKIGLEQPHLTIDFPLAIIDYALGEQMRACNLALFTSVKMNAGGKEISTMQLFFPFFDMVGYIWRKMSKRIMEETGREFIG
jgi:chemotaxis protein CheC